MVNLNTFYTFMGQLLSKKIMIVRNSDTYKNSYTFWNLDFSEWIVNVKLKEVKPQQRLRKITTGLFVKTDMLLLQQSV